MTGCNFAVHKVNNYWDSDRYETLEEATNFARTQAWRHGEDYGIFKMIAQAEKPEYVNTVRVIDIS